jgi:hypothetical protein
MGFETSIRILFGLVAAFVLVTLVRALRTGRAGYGSAAVARASDPSHYRFSIALLAAMAGAIAVLMVDFRLGSAAVQLQLVLSVAYYPWLWLRTGEAGWETALFSRRDEPLQYWLLVAPLTLAIAAATALAAANALDAWRS